jgi:hypothetical protein
MDGGDCNDSDPTISSLEIEVCGNARDDDCDELLDEPECTLPAHDTCADALDLLTSGRSVLRFAGLASDYAASCAPSGGAYRDAVIAIRVPEGPAQDVEITVTTTQGTLALAAGRTCGDPASELGCAGSYSSEQGGVIARVRLRSLPPGPYPVYVFGAAVGEVSVDVSYEPASTAPGNETCASAAPLLPGQHQTVELLGVTADLTTACGAEIGELVYAFTLAEASDVRLRGSSIDGIGRAVLSLRDSQCSEASDELTCRTGAVADLFAPRLPAGMYHVAVSATAPTLLDLVLEVTAPTVAPAGENCSDAPPLAPGLAVGVELLGYADDVQVGCAVGAADAAYALELGEPSDVLLLARMSARDTAALSLVGPACTPDDVLACQAGPSNPLRAIARGVASGSYRAVIESQNGTPLTIEALLRRAGPPSAVPFADACGSAITIPAEGGFFQGNTANLGADFEASCDRGGQLSGGAPDQLLRLSLTESKRVVLDMQASEYETLLNVRRGAVCPGAEVVRGCAAGYQTGRSFLDLVLEAGEHFVQIDGYDGSSGPWSLDVFIADP